MRKTDVLAVVALSLALSGCDLVTSREPIGLPLALDEEQWEGTWMTDDGPLTVRVVDAEKGRLEIAWIEEKDGELVLETVDGHLGQYLDWTFASFAGVEDVSGFLWSRLEREGERIFLWWPRPEELRRLVEAGLLPGEVDEDSDVILHRLDEAHLAILVSEEQGILYEWDEPMTFHRWRGE